MKARKSSNKSIVYIDGENFVHSAIGLLGKGKTRDDLIELDLKKMISTIVGHKKEAIEVRYYTTKIKFSGVTVKTHNRLKEIVEFNARWLSRLASQEIKVVRAGILRSRESKPCKKCGLISDTFVEKGLDVRLAVDIIEVSIRSNSRKIYLLSSDLDLLPAIEFAKAHKNKVVYIASAKAVNRALVASTSEVLTFTKKDIEEAK